MSKLYLLLGGNLGDKKTIFFEVRILLNEHVGQITAESAIYETEPWGFESNDLFWNQAIEICTALSPEEVLLQIQQIEMELGRIRKESQYTSRIIDIDILFFGGEIIDLPQLIVPHPRIHERKFALVPLNEIAPELIHPVFQKSIQELLDECADQLKVNAISDLTI
jgi:2-amino-4-hydroxy-6-hydroxymethyldihydropteridine diphosphokinase